MLRCIYKLKINNTEDKKMEIKTCEQYVVSELMDTKEKLEHTQEVYDNLKVFNRVMCEKYEKLVSIIQKYASFGCTTGTSRISISTIWDDFDSQDDYRYLVKEVLGEPVGMEEEDNE